MSAHRDHLADGLTAEEEALLQQYGQQNPPTGTEQPAERVVEGGPTEQEREAGQAPPEPRGGQPVDEHPDNLPFLSLETDEAAAEIRRRLEEDPAELVQRLRNGTLRLSDYTRKTKKAAELTKQAEEQLRQAQEAQEQFRQQYAEQRPLPPSPQQPPPPPGPQGVMDPETFASWYERQHGRQATQADYLCYRVDAMVEPLVDKKVQERTSKFQQDIMEREMQQIQTRAEAQYEELCKEFPEASDPLVRGELASLLAQLNTDLSKGDEMRRAYLFSHPELLDKAREQGLDRRKQQVERREQEAAPPPGGGSIGTTTVPVKSTNLDDIAEAQKKDPALIQRLVGLYQSMRG